MPTVTHEDSSPEDGTFNPKVLPVGTLSECGPLPGVFFMTVQDTRDEILAVNLSTGQLVRWASAKRILAPSERIVLQNGSK